MRWRSPDGQVYFKINKVASLGRDAVQPGAAGVLEDQLTNEADASDVAAYCRLRLATRQSLTGSPPLAKAIGIIVVAALATIAEAL